MRVRRRGWRGFGLMLGMVSGSVGCGVVEELTNDMQAPAMGEVVRESNDDLGPSAQWKQPSSSCEGVVPSLPEPRFVSFSRMSEAGTGFAPVLSPLIGGGLALRVEGQWVAELPSRKTQVKSAPAWLASAPAWHSLTIIREGRAYALAPDVGAEPPDACRSTVFLHAPAGNRCGALMLPEGACTSGQLGIGRDGTLVELLPEPADNTRAYRYWTGLLR